jgi:FkbM family methyltransferase
MLGLGTRARRLRYGLDYGRMVHERGRFALNEALNTSRVGSYSLRDGGIAVGIRHHPSPDGTPSNDTWTLREIFREDCYAPPRAVEAVLRDARPGPRVVDLGANIGLFAAFVLARYPAATVTAFEPDPDSARILRDTLTVAGGRCDLREACAAASDGTLRFAHGRHQFSHIADRDEEGVIEVPAVDVFPFMRDADLAKIDIEGGEWELLADPRMATDGPRSIVMEYHPRLCPEADPRALAERLLREHGYEIVDPLGQSGDEPIAWAVKRDRT